MVEIKQIKKSVGDDEAWEVPDHDGSWKPKGV